MEMQVLIVQGVTWTYLLGSVGLGIFAALFPKRFLRMSRRDYPDIDTHAVAIRIGGTGIALMGLLFIYRYLGEHQG